VTKVPSDDEVNLLLFHLNPSSVWSAADLSAEPQIRLIEWTIKQDQHGNRYFVGTRADDRTGRVSTRIVEFDENRRRGRTQSGRVYELVGPPGYSSNGEYVWSTYKRVNKIVEDKK
jgi:hypothetical protein